MKILLPELPRKKKSRDIHTADIATFFPPFSETCFTDLEKLLLQSDTISAVPVERSEHRYSARSGGDNKDHASFRQQLSRAS